MKKLKNIEEYNEIIYNGKSVLLFSADWCPDCRVIEPILPDIEKAFSDLTFYYVDRDEFIDLCGELDVFGIPSFVVYEDGKEIGRFVSKERKTEDEIIQFLSSL